MIIKDNHIIAEKNKVLHCTWDNQLYGKEVWLGKVYYKDNIKLDTPYDLSVDDFKEIDNPEEEVEYEVIDNKIYYFQGKSYAEIKTFIIKLHYSNDDQIAIILNNDEEKMRKMQEWREYASLTAKKYSN